MPHFKVTQTRTEVRTIYLHAKDWEEAEELARSIPDDATDHGIPEVTRIETWDAGYNDTDDYEVEEEDE